MGDIALTVERTCCPDGLELLYTDSSLGYSYEPPARCGLSMPSVLDCGCGCDMNSKLIRRGRRGCVRSAEWFEFVAFVEASSICRRNVVGVQNIIGLRSVVGPKKLARRVHQPRNLKLGSGKDA